MIRLEVEQKQDETGVPEEYTDDLYPLIEADYTKHLMKNGLPRVGAVIVPGMIIVGKIGRSKRYNRKLSPNCRELHRLPFEEVRRRYGRMWINTSLCATKEMSGIVKRAYFIESSKGVKAVVEIEPS